jgi:hypothetical protein
VVAGLFILRKSWRAVAWKSFSAPKTPAGFFESVDFGCDATDLVPPHLKKRSILRVSEASDIRDLL